MGEGEGSCNNDGRLLLCECLMINLHANLRFGGSPRKLRVRARVIQPTAINEEQESRMHVCIVPYGVWSIDKGIPSCPLKKR